MMKWLVMFAVARAAFGQAPMRYVHNGPESPSDARYDYHWHILRVALEKTKAEYGPYEIASAPAMTERRQVSQLRSGSGTINILILGPTAEMERDLLPIRIPVDKNLNGYNLLLVRSERLADLASARTLEDLRRLKIGLGQGWIDVDILRANGLNVVTGSSYDGLFDMLDNGRFDAFQRSAIEILDELAVRKDRMPDLVIEPTLCIFYPLPMYFWFSRSPAGERLAARVEKGMWMMLADGTYDQIFSAYQDHKIRELKLAERRILRLENPQLRMQPSFDKRLWFDPQTYRPRARRHE